MNFAIHTKQATAAADLRDALEESRDELLGSEKLAAERQAGLDQLEASAKSLPPGEARNSLVAARAQLAAQPAPGIGDPALRKEIEERSAVVIDAACALVSSGVVNVTVSGSDRVDEDILGRLTVQIDFVDVKGLAARLARQPPPEVQLTITEGSVSAPPL